MKTPNSRIANLKEMIVLEEKRAQIQSQIAAIDERLAILQNDLYGSAPASSAPVVAQRKPVIKAVRKQRGALKQQVLEALQAVGSNGITVKQLASQLGVKTTNIHSWFSANMKKIAGLKKIGEAQYVLNGTAKPAAKKAAAPATVKAPKASKAVTFKKAPAKGGKKTARRGELKDRILEELKQAGDGGITIKALSEKLDAKYKNVYIWFMTTGKRISGIKKVGPAQYKLAGA